MLPMELVFSREFNQDPYAFYAELREKGPVHRIDFPPGVEAYLIVDYEYGRAALSDPRLSKDPANSAVPVKDRVYFNGTMLGVDPPEHTRLRQEVAKGFTARRIEALRPRVQEITDELIAGLVPGDDLIAKFAFPLPIIVICELLDIPAEDRDAFRAWSAALTVPNLTEEMIARRRRAAGELFEYLGRLIAQGHDLPSQDIGTLALLLIAGHETTVNLIGNGVLALLRNPAQIPRFRDVEELLRYDPPVERASQRIALEDLEIAGTRIPKGAWVHVSIGAANRDPKAFPEPDSLDLDRRGTTSLAFGHGIHYCLGAPLARMEGEIAIGTLFERLPTLALKGEAEWNRTGSIVRGLKALPVTF